MCIPHIEADPKGDFVGPARLFQPKPSRSTSSASSRRNYATSERSPRHSGSYTVPPPPTQMAAVEKRSPRKSNQLMVPPPVIVQQVAPKPAHSNSGFVLPAPDPPVSYPLPLPSPDYPPSLTQRTSVRRPKTSSSGASVPPPAPEAPPATREEHHYHHHYYYPAVRSREHSRSTDSTRGRSSTRHSSASRSTHTPLSSRFPARTNSTSGRSDRYSTTTEPPPSKASAKSSSELPRRSISTRSTKYLEQPRRKDAIVIENKDGSRVKQYYYP